MGKWLREISHFFVAPRREFAPAVRARPRTLFSINTSTSVQHRIIFSGGLRGGRQPATNT